jgi:hypothetical protein
MPTNKTIVTTTIFPPSKAIREFLKFKDWTLVVVGDKKTPHEEYRRIPEIIYLDPEYQETTYRELSDLIGWNCIQRRNIGYVEAYRRGADIIATIDDDNIPYADWGSQLFLGTSTDVTMYTPLETTVAWDPFSATNYKHLWHRGFPLDLITTKNDVTPQKTTIVPSIQADFWNGDPDVDAVERLIYAPSCTFDPAPFPICGTAMSPFNSQNTFFTRDAMKDFFLFPFVGRMDDIWGSFYAQAKGHRVVYNRPTVFQERNVHTHLVDFDKEILGYKENSKLMADLLIDSERIQRYIPDRSYSALKEYTRYFE